MDRSIRGGPQARHEVPNGPGASLNLPAGLGQAENNQQVPSQTRNQYFTSPGGATSGYAASMLSGMGNNSPVVSQGYNHNSYQKPASQLNLPPMSQAGNRPQQNMQQHGGSMFSPPPNNFDDGGSILGPSASQIGQPSILGNLQQQAQQNNFSGQNQAGSPANRRNVNFNQGSVYQDGSSGIFKDPF